ncbi:MAG: hypothetical protein H8D72_02100 [Planctomycetes bacterium]|nr:hypothetical protein [Planctomycetota bacterium]
MVRFSRFPSLLALAALCLLIPGAFAGTVTVGPLGSGADFGELGEAIAAAQPGDVVLVAAGDYEGFGSLVVDKPLTILGSGSASTRYVANVKSIFELPVPLRVENLQAGEEVRVAGLGLRCFSFGGYANVAVVVENCAGPVVLADVVHDGTSVIVSTEGLVQIRSSQQVTLDDCRFVAMNGDNQTTTPALVVDSSTVYVNDCALVGDDASAFSVFVVPPGAPAIVALQSELRLSRTLVRGGDGAGSGFIPTPMVSSGGPGIEAVGSQVFVRGGAGNLLRGGAGGWDPVGSTPLSGSGGPAANLDIGSVLTTTSDSGLLSGVDGDGAFTTPLSTGAGSWLPQPFALATLESSASLVAPGSLVAFEQSGEPGSTGLTFFGFAQALAFEPPGIFGPLVLPLSSLSFLAPSVLDAAGSTSQSVPVPASSAFVGVTVLVQTLQVDLAGTLSLSGPVFVGIR